MLQVMKEHICSIFSGLHGSTSMLHYTTESFNLVYLLLLVSPTHGASPEGSDGRFKLFGRKKSHNNSELEFVRRHVGDSQVSWK